MRLQEVLVSSATRDKSLKHLQPFPSNITPESLKLFCMVCVALDFFNENENSVINRGIRFAFERALMVGAVEDVFLETVMYLAQDKWPSKFSE